MIPLLWAHKMWVGIGYVPICALLSPRIRGIVTQNCMHDECGVQNQIPPIVCSVILLFYIGLVIIKIDELISEWGDTNTFHCCKIDLLRKTRALVITIHSLIYVYGETKQLDN